MGSKETFTEIYEKNLWRDDESVSGSGSRIENTETLIQELPLLLERFEIESLLDCPCGDCNWMYKVDLGDIKYIGADVVEELINENIKKYGDIFIIADITKDFLPKTDAILVRDCFVHLPIKDIAKALLNIYASGIKYLIVTNFPEHKENIDIPMGHWRTLNFMEYPFNLPEPLYTLNEGCMEADGVFSDKSLCVWDMETVLQCIIKYD